MKQLSLLFALLFVSIVGYGQITASSYSFTPLSGTFTDISATGTLATGVMADDATQSGIDIGFTFNYCGTDYTTLSACSNGWLSLSNYGSSDNQNSAAELPYVGGGAGLLMAYWNDMNGASYIAVPGSAYYQTIGSTVGSRIFVFQWVGYIMYGFDGYSQDFEVILHEGSNQIDFVYNNGTLAGAGFTGGATIGIANSSTDWQTLQDVSSSPAYSSTTFTTDLSTSPFDGQIYRWTPPPACAGTPVAGIAHADAISACVSDNITLSLTGTSVVTGLSYQWQSSTDSISWTDIAGGTTLPYSTTIPGTTTIYYRAKVTCDATGDFDSSVGVRVDYLPYCYCVPSYYYSPATYTYSGSLSLFEVNGEGGSAISDAGPATIPTSGYSNLTGISVDMQQGNTYTGTLNYSYNVYGYESQIWIDYNDDGTFDASEEATPVISSGLGSYVYSDPFSIVVPITATVGTHRMRVRYANIQYPSGLSSHMDPCNYSDVDNYYYYGNTRDYTVNILPAPACAGTPVGGVATSTAGLSCPTTVFNLAATGSSVASGLTYQWQSSSTLGGTYSDITGATSPTYSGSETAPTYYQLVVTCPASATSGASTPVFVNFLTACYCTPTYDYSPASTSSYGLDVVDLTGYAGSTINDAGPAVIPASGFEDRTSITVDLQQGNTYSGSLSYVSSFYPNYESQIWIDFNDNGTFEASEAVTSVITSGYGMYAISDPFTLNVPLSAPVGLHVMRVRYAYIGYTSTNSAAMDPCANTDPTLSSSFTDYYNGTTRDYMANIVAAPACAGAPTGGTAIASATLACPATAFTLNATGGTIASGLTYQWQSSTTGTAGSFTDIAGATTQTYSYTETAPTYYQLVTTCAAAPASATSTAVFVNYFGFCYCTPSYVYSPATSYGLDVVALTGFGGSTLSDAGPAVAAPSGYEDRTSLPATDLQQGGSYSGTLSYISGGYEYENQIWIDFNDNGIFESTEAVTPVVGTGLCSSYVYSDAYTITIPMTAPVGIHRMRVRNAYTYSCGLSTAMDPCNSSEASSPYYSYYYGTSRDYNINIIALPACTGTPVAGAASASPSAGGMPTVFTLSLPGLVSASGLGFQWQSGASATGPWTDIAGATNPTYIFTGISTTSYYQAVVTCVATSGVTTATPVTITYVPIPLCTPTSASWNGSSSPSYGISSFSVTGAGTSTISDLTIQADAAPVTGYLNRASMSVDMIQGNSYASSVDWSPVSLRQDVQVWIDFNDDLIYQPSEEVTPVSGYSTSSTPSPTLFNITIPSSATLGVHNMRVRGVWELWSSVAAGAPPAHLDPCLVQYSGLPLIYLYGDVVDYRANILSPCPFTATATTVGGAICPLAPVSLTASTTAPTYSWTGPDGFTSTSLATTAPGIATTGVYSFTATDGTCTVTLTTTQNLLPAAPAPVVTPAIASICSGSSQTITATVPGMPGTVVFSEDFNAGLGSWTVDNTGSSSSSALGPWQSQPDGYYYGGNTFHSPDASSFVITNADAGGPVVTSSILISPVFSLAGLTDASLSFQHYLHAYYADITVAVDISTDGGATWTTLHDYSTVTTGSAAGFQTDTYPLTSYIGSTTCQLRYNYNSDYGYYWALDNVLVTGTPTVGPAPTWSPVTNLYSDPAFTTPYVAGTAAYEVYMQAPTASTTTTTNYIASVPLGTCNSVDTSVITVIGVAPIVVVGGTTSLCGGSSISLTNPSTGGTWTSSNTTVATVDASGVVYGIASGADTIYYNISGCSAYVVVNVSTVITPNTGTTVLCSGGLTATLSNVTTGGTWTSSAPSVASVSAGGVVTTGAVGTAIVTYTFPSGCSDTSVITSVAPPAAITGTATVCYNGGTTTLSETTTGGTWSITAPTVATITGSGATITITGLTSGTADVVYTTLPGCTAIRTLILNANPANITGTMAVCASGGATTLSDATGTGTWTSGTPSRATISSGGVVTGVTSGTTVITFTAANGCYDTALVTVNALPSAITGTTTICNLASTTLADASTPGTWTTSTPSITTVNASGVVTALTSGTGTIIFTQTSTGCTRSATVTVNALPGAITGTTTLCNTTSTTLSSIPSGGTWTTSAPTIASVNSVSGLVSALSPGSATITLTNAAGCKASTTVTVNPSFVPSVVITPTPGAAVCAGTAVDYVPTVTNGGTAPTYSWTVNSVPVSAASSYNYTPLDGDVVTVTIVSNLGCAIPSSASSSVTMTVNPIVTPSLTLGTAYGDTGCVGLSTTIYTYPVSAVQVLPSSGL